MSNAKKMLKRNNTEMTDVRKLGPFTPPSHRQVMRVENKSKKRRRLIRKQREDDEGNTFSLPEELLFKILLRIPAQDLHAAVRYVCKHLFDIITDPVFVRTHSQMSSPGFLIQSTIEDSKMSYIEADTTRFKVTEIQFPFPARIMGAINGLVLLHDLTYPDIFHVMNPATKVNFSLPPLTGLCNIDSRAGFGLTCSGVYKVVHVSPKAPFKLVRMRVFTLGVDTAWRFIDLKGISIDVNKFAFKNFPRFIGGFIYWHDIVKFNGVALDVNTEMIYQFSPPNDLVIRDGYGTPIRFLSMGTCLGLLRQWQKGDVWRLWKLTGVKTGEWTEMPGINIQPVRSMVDKTFYPRELWGVWPLRLINGVFWFYRRFLTGEYLVVRYDLVSSSFSFSPITQVLPETLIHPHVHTLLSPENCKSGILCSSIDDYYI